LHQILFVFIEVKVGDRQIDISKASFDVAFLDDDKYQNKKFKNDLKGFKNLTKWLKQVGDRHKTLFTSLKTYWDALCHYLLIQSPLDKCNQRSSKMT
jgi:hypothetical protein